MANKENKNTAKQGVFATLWRWAKRMFMGASKELVEDDRFVVEKIESPSMMAVKAFFRRKLAVVALVVLVSLFLFVFIGPNFFPMDLNYTDPLQANMTPIYSLLKVPADLASNVRTISSFSDFSVGVSEENNFYLWGKTKNSLTNVDYNAQMPEEIQPGKVLTAAAGSDHIIAITTDGKIVGWGNKSTGQYGYTKVESDPYIQMPTEFIEGTIDPNSVEQLICGYQVTGLILDGRLYMWGNPNTMLSLKEFANSDKFNSGVKKVAFSNYYAIVLYEDGTVSGGQTLTFNRQSAYSSVEGKIKNLKSHLADKKVIDITASNNCYALLTDAGEMIVFGAVEYGENEIPVLPEGEKFTSVSAGTRHFVATTNTGAT